MLKECDNKWACHTPVTVAEDKNALRVLCRTCKRQYVLRKDWRAVQHNRDYSKVFKKDILQPHENLFYKYYPHYLRT